MAHDDPFAGKKITGDWAYDLNRSGSFTPTPTASGGGLDLGTGGSANGIYQIIGHRVFVEFNITFGTSSSPGTGTLLIAQPFDADTSLYSTSWGFGMAYLVDVGTGANRQSAVIEFNTASTVRMRPNGAALVTNSVPCTWTDTDNFWGFWSYLADPNDLP